MSKKDDVEIDAIRARLKRMTIFFEPVQPKKNQSDLFGEVADKEKPEN